MSNKGYKTIALDFDNTCCRDSYPTVGNTINGSVEVLKDLISRGYRIILWTCREHVNCNGVDPLQEALNWFEKNDISLFDVNNDATVEERGYFPSRKVHADFIIDDKCVGIPLIDGCVDWFKVKTLIP